MRKEEIKEFKEKADAFLIQRKGRCLFRYGSLQFPQRKI